MFSTILTKVMRRKSISAKQLSIDSNIDRTVLSRIISGSREPNYKHITSIACALKVGIHVLFSREYNEHHITKSNKTIFLNGWIISLIYADDLSKVVATKIVCDTDLHIPSSAFLTDSSRNSKVIWTICEGRAIIAYENSSRILCNTNYYIFKGYEKYVDIKAGTRIYCVVINTTYKEEIKRFMSIKNKDYIARSTTC